MNINFNDLRVILSIIFIFMGSSVFYIASLISGHNLYRDIEFQFSILISTIIGFFVFIFSPLSFIVLFPSLFRIDHARNIDKLLIINIHEAIIKNIMMPYLLSATGLGIVFGCFASIQIRALFLRKVRKSIAIDFPMRTYGFSWDDFLYDIKKNGTISFKMRNNNHETAKNENENYQLVGFSIKNKPKELALKNINTKGTFDVLVTNIDSIEEICVPAESLKKDYRSETPSSYALHLSLAAMGLIMLFESFHLTGDFLKSEQYRKLGELYIYCGTGFLIIAFLSSYASLKFLLEDYKCRKSAFILCYFPGLFLCIESSVILLSIIHIAALEYISVAINGKLFITFNFFIVSAIFVLLVLFYILFLQYNMRYLLKTAIVNALAGKQKDDILKQLELVILSFDENDPAAKLKLNDYPAVRDVLRNLKTNMPTKLAFLVDEREIQLIKSCFWHIKNLEAPHLED